MNTVELIRERYEYREGEVYYKSTPRQKPELLGKRAGSVYSNGYRVITINKKRYPETHIIWALHHGYLPRLQVDHKDRNPLNNHISNLREATYQQQRGNISLNSNNTSGYRGVRASHLPLRPWRAMIGVDGKKINLGAFADPWEAAVAYNKAAIEYFGEFAVLNKERNSL